MNNFKFLALRVMHLNPGKTEEIHKILSRPRWQQYRTPASVFNKTPIVRDLPDCHANRVSLRELASRAGISYDTARAVEAGNLLTGLGAYLALIWTLGLEREFAHLTHPDADIEGKQLELVRTPERARRKKGNLDADF